MRFRLGLTGSIGMGKSTTASMFADLGADVWDADVAVHRLYAKDGLAVPLVGALCPSAVEDGVIDREALKNWIVATPDALNRLEAVVHPLVGQDREAFAATSEAHVLVFDIPLLFEKGVETSFDAVACVNTTKSVQSARVLARSRMTQTQFETILARQIPNVQKCALADYVIDTSNTKTARRDVQAVMDQITGASNHA